MCGAENKNKKQAIYTMNVDTTNKQGQPLSVNLPHGNKIQQHT